MASSNHKWRLLPASPASQSDCAPKVAMDCAPPAVTDCPPPAVTDCAQPIAAADTRQEDFRLVQRLIAGDDEAWQTFVRRFQRLVLTRVHVVGREVNQSLAQADAEDLCAEVFSQLVAHNYGVLRRFEGRSTLSTWLCVVTRRIALRRLSVARREPSRPAAQPPLSLESLPAAADESPLKMLIGGEDRALLAAAVAQLGERQRQLACLFYIDGCSYREISRQLEMPINSIGPTLVRIHDKLRAAMKQEE